MILSEARERDVVGNNIPENMREAERKLEQLSEATIRETEGWDWDWDWKWNWNSFWKAYLHRERASLKAIWRLWSCV